MKQLNKNIMSKEITCRMIDGKPVVEYKEEYVPKKGDIVVSRNNRAVWIAVYDSCGEFDNDSYSYQKMFYLNDVDNAIEKFSIIDFNFCCDNTYTRKATPEEAEVMHHILNENGYELKGDTVVKKRWIPKMYEEYYFIKCVRKEFGIDMGNRGGTDDSLYMGVFRTKEAAQSACDKLNELLISLPQG